MKLHFEDNLDYQKVAIEAVVELFCGQDINPHGIYRFKAGGPYRAESASWHGRVHSGHRQSFATPG